MSHAECWTRRLVFSREDEDPQEFYSKILSVHSVSTVLRNHVKHQTDRQHTIPIGIRFRTEPQVRYDLTRRFGTYITVSPITVPQSMSIPNPE